VSCNHNSNNLVTNTRDTLQVWREGSELFLLIFLLPEAATRGVEEAHNILRPLFSVPKEPTAISGIINSQRTGLQGRLSEQSMPRHQTHQPQYQRSSENLVESQVDYPPSPNSTPRRHPQYENRSHSIDSSLREVISIPSSTPRAGSRHPLAQSSLSQSSIMEQELPHSLPLPPSPPQNNPTFQKPQVPNLSHQLSHLFRFPPLPFLLQ
jgi:hypothetical protein